MYCIKCGKENPDDAVYCQKCGNLVESEEETRVVRRETATARAGETPIFSIRPTLLFVKVGYALAVIAAIVLAGLLSMFLPAISPWYAVLLGFALLLIPAYYHFRQKLVRYTLNESQIEIDTGLIAQNKRNIPLRRIQDVTVTSSVPQRLLGFGDIVIDNASEDGGKIVLRNVNSPKEHADLLLKQLHKLDT